MPIIEVENITKRFRARRTSKTLLGRGGLGDLVVGRQKRYTTALNDVSCSVEPGESLGIIGANGSGKSTLLKIIAGVTLPSSGHVTVRGRVASLLELGAGFHPMLTGRENVYINAGLLGMRHRQVDKLFDRIVEFSGIEEFIDEPVDTYSSGMYVRIGFAVAAFCNPDIFLVDEVLSVGDEAFQRKCQERIAELREQGKTIVFVSHDLGAVSTLCERVVLLSRGEMISHGSARTTIDFYLRQIGRQTGIHRMSAGNVETIFSHGRVSVFHEQREISAARGFQVQLKRFDHWHNAEFARWEITDRSADSCTACGWMTRLPVKHVWRFELEEGRLKWRIAFECDREVALDALEVTLFLPQVYDRWFLGEQSGTFPTPAPSDLTWVPVAPIDFACREAGVLPEDGSDLVPVLVGMETDKDYIALQLQNTEYVGGCRVIHVYGNLPETAHTFQPGRHDLVTLEVDLDSSPAQIQQRIQDARLRRMLYQGDLAARFQDGCIRLYHRETELTRQFCVYASLLIGNLWNDSPSWRWGSIDKDDKRIEVTGEARRFPFKQHWRLGAVAGGFELEVRLEALEPLDVQEYHLSVELVDDYDHWETEHETGAFPELQPGDDDWMHVNRDYAPGSYIRAWGGSLPAVTLRSTTDDLSFRMTAINSDYRQSARVLQALRTPDRGLLHFESGTHLYFAGKIEFDTG